MRAIQFIKVRFDKRTDKITQEWLDARQKFFIEHTYPSIIRQSVQDFHLWIQCQKGMINDVAILQAYLPNAIFTFGDQPVRVEDMRYPPYMSSLQNADMVYVTRIDSDDLYSNDAIYWTRRVIPTTNDRVTASMFRRGYIHDVNTNRVGVYSSSSTPFHTLMIPGDIFRNPERYEREVWKPYGDHSKVGFLNPYILPEYKFTVLIHKQNFLSDFNYARESGQWIDPRWTMQKACNPPIVFDVDDFCDEWNCLDEMRELKSIYPNFKATLFTIPERTSKKLLEEAYQYRDWLELCPHGITHSPNEEMKNTTEERLYRYLLNIDYKYYTMGFRAPGWTLHEGIVRALNKLGYWLAPHPKDASKYGRKCEHGYYACGERYPYYHGHTHDTCNNWIRKDLEKIKTQFSKDQKFAFVSESILLPPNY